MNQDLYKLALIGLSAGFCLSAQAAPSNKSSGKEIAMAKCSKDSGGQKKSNNSCSGSSSCNGQSSCGSYNGEDDEASFLEGKKKGAAKKALEGG